MKHILAHQFIDGLKKYLKIIRRTEGLDWSSRLGKGGAYTVRFFKTHPTRRANRRKSSTGFYRRGM